MRESPTLASGDGGKSGQETRSGNIVTSIKSIQMSELIWKIREHSLCGPITQTGRRCVVLERKDWPAEAHKAFEEKHPNDHGEVISTPGT